MIAGRHWSSVEPTKLPDSRRLCENQNLLLKNDRLRSSIVFSITLSPGSEVFVCAGHLFQLSGIQPGEFGRSRTAAGACRCHFATRPSKRQSGTTGYPVILYEGNSCAEGFHLPGCCRIRQFRIARQCANQPCSDRRGRYLMTHGAQSKSHRFIEELGTHMTHSALHGGFITVPISLIHRPSSQN